MIIGAVSRKLQCRCNIGAISVQYRCNIGYLGARSLCLINTRDTRVALTEEEEEGLEKDQEEYLLTINKK